MGFRKVLVNLEATPSCPAACAMCPRDLIKDHGYMSIETMEKVISQVDTSMSWEIDLAGRGEPTLHPQLLELAKIMARPGVLTGIVTTGVAMTPPNVEALEKHFGVIRLSVSSYVRSIYEKVHIGLNFEKIWRNVETLARVGAHKTVVHLTGGPVIYDGLPETVEHLRKLGFKRFKLLTLWNRAGHFQSNEDRDRRKALISELGLETGEDEVWASEGRMRFVSDIAFNKLRNPKYCPIGASSISISYKGDIIGCFQDFGHVSVVGNVHQMDIRTHLERRYSELGNMKICQGCDAHKVSLFQVAQTKKREAPLPAISSS